VAFILAAARAARRRDKKLRERGLGLRFWLSTAATSVRSIPFPVCAGSAEVFACSITTMADDCRPLCQRLDHQATVTKAQIKNAVAATKEKLNPFLD